MKTAIISGACGFIGFNLTTVLLENNYKVIALVTDEKVFKNNLNPNLKVIKIFFEDYHTLIQIIKGPVDYFFHLAWAGVYGHAFKDYELQIYNSKISCLCAKQAVELGVKKFIFCSTINVLETQDFFNKNTEIKRYTNVYAAAKLSAEMYCKVIASNSLMQYNSVLINQVFGSGNRHPSLTNIVLKNLVNNIESNLVEYDELYSLIHVKDVALGLLSVATKGLNMSRYYLGNTTLETIGQTFDRIKTLVNPDGIINYGVYPASSFIDYSLIDLNKLYNDTGFKPSSNFEENILDNVAWIKENL